MVDFPAMFFSTQFFRVSGTADASQKRPRSPGTGEEEKAPQVVQEFGPEGRLAGIPGRSMAVPLHWRR